MDKRFFDRLDELIERIYIKPWLNVAFSIKKIREKLIKEIEDRGAYNKIIRSIEFAPEHYQAGMSILSYFKTFLTNKYPEKNIKVRIEQQGLIVRMIIETTEGEKEEIEQTLENYGLLLRGERQIDTFFNNPMHALELKQQLRIAYLQIESQKEMLHLSSKQYGDRIESLEDEIKWLRMHVGKLLGHSETISKLISITINDLSQFFDKSNEAIMKELNFLYEKLNIGIQKRDEVSIKHIFKNLKRQNESGFIKLMEFLKDCIIKGSISGASGHLLYDFIRKFM